MQPQDEIDGYYERRYIEEYSRLSGRKYFGADYDENRLNELEQKISAASMSKYLEKFSANAMLNRTLVELAQEGTITELVLGQDDGEPFSIPNIEKEKLKKYLVDNKIGEDKVFLTHGADEIAYSLLAAIKCAELKETPKVYLKFADNCADKIMPYMAVSMSETSHEKIRLLGGKIISDPTKADFILFVSAVNNNDERAKSRADSARFIKNALESGEQVALVDLSEHFRRDETILPLLTEQNAALNALIAYGGWNTASNSVGTTTAQAAVFAAMKKRADNRGELLNLYAKNIPLLNNRFLEDSFYLKQVIDEVNSALKKTGYVNTADLDLEHNYRFANNMLHRGMKQQIDIFRRLPAFCGKFSVTSPFGKIYLRADNLNADISYPWPRTFEIYLSSSVNIYEMPSP